MRYYVIIISFCFKFFVVNVVHYLIFKRLSHMKMRIARKMSAHNNTASPHITMELFKLYSTGFGECKFIYETHK